MMVGRDLDVDNVDLSSCINETGYSDRFVLLGERSDVPVCLSAMDIFCLHSRTEGFPNVLGEAMAMGLPCVATDVGDAALLLADGGVIVPKKNSAALAQGLEKLCRLTPAGRIALGKKSKHRVRDEFSMTRTRDRFEAIYTKIVSRNVS
jgi:glycosyltransferase involved in cell wall biosynthesis